MFSNAAYLSAATDRPKAPLFGSLHVLGSDGGLAEGTYISNKVEIVNELKNLRYHRSHFSGCRWRKLL